MLTALVTDLRYEIVGARGATLVLRAPAELGHETASSLVREAEIRLPNCDHPAMVLDMAGVEVISSIGITALLQLKELCLDRGGLFIIADLSAGQLEFLRMLHLDRKFEVRPTVEEAIEHAEAFSG